MVYPVHVAVVLGDDRWTWNLLDLSVLLFLDTVVSIDAGSSAVLNAYMGFLSIQTTAVNSPFFAVRN